MKKLAVLFAMSVAVLILLIQLRRWQIVPGEVTIARFGELNVEGLVLEE